MDTILKYMNNLYLIHLNRNINYKYILSFTKIYFETIIFGENLFEKSETIHNIIGE